MTLEKKLELLAELGRTNIVYNPIFDSYTVSISTLTLYIKGEPALCKAEDVTIEKAIAKLINLMGSAEKIIYGRFSSEEKVITFSFTERRAAI